MLDNFRRRDIPQSTRLQSPYNRLQEALSSAGAEPAKPEAFGIEPPQADSRGDPEPTRPAHVPARRSPAPPAVAHAVRQRLQGNPEWTAQAGTQPQQPSKPAAESQASAQPQPGKPAGTSH